MFNLAKSGFITLSVASCGLWNLSSGESVYGQLPIGGHHPSRTEVQENHLRNNPGHRPPVHVTPTSPTAQPVRGFRPDLEVVQTQRHQAAPVMGLQDRVEQAVTKQRAQTQLKRVSTSHRQLSNGLPQRIPATAGEPKTHLMQAQSVVESPRFNRDSRVSYASMSSDQMPQASHVSQDWENRYPAQPASYREHPSINSGQAVNTEIYTLESEVAVDELWADDLPSERGQKEIQWSDPVDQPQPLSLPDPVKRGGFQSNQNPRPQSILQNPKPAAPPMNQSSHSRFRQDLEELEFGMERDNDGRAQGLRSLIDEQEPNRLGLTSDSDTDGLLDRSCEYYRGQLFSTAIQDIALDISPPGIYADSSKKNFVTRNWTDRQGNVIAKGTMIDMRRGYVILDNGQRLPYGRLGESDLIAISDYWNLPKVCGVENRGQVERYWHPLTYTYTASSLCHKPLYFENIQLERYGHTHGPIMQPVRSVAHFFVRLATLPYHTAIHPANECEYPLGLYRPGDCAPWLKDPIPLSLGGVRRQAAVVGGWVAVLP